MGRDYELERKIGDAACALEDAFYIAEAESTQPAEIAALMREAAEKSGVSYAAMFNFEAVIKEYT